MNGNLFIISSFFASPEGIQSLSSEHCSLHLVYSIYHTLHFNMSVNSWDFREILDCYPDRPSFTCVGITKKGKRCGQWMFSDSDLSCASRMLDEMSCYEKLSSSYKDLEKLAGLTLCPRMHREPGYNQVHRVSLEWRTKIAMYGEEFERKREKAAMMKSERALASVRENLSNIKVKLEEEEANNKVYPQSDTVMQILMLHSVRFLPPTHRLSKNRRQPI